MTDIDRIKNYYGQFDEWGRLDTPDGQIVFERTLALFKRYLRPNTRILDLACGPGLYSQRLAQLGHICVGIDFSPASVAYAQSQAVQADLTIDYVCGDIRTVGYGEGFDLAMLIFGEFNVFTEADAQQLLGSIHQALTTTLDLTGQGDKYHG